MMLKKLLSIVLALSFLGILTPVGFATASPVVTVSPDTLFSPNETQYINGTGFQANTSVRIDLIFPSGTTIEGITSDTTNIDGNFSLTLITPNVDGQGYVKIICGSDILSTLVTFQGDVIYDLDVSYPDEIFMDEPANFIVEESSLDDQNYIIDVEITDSDDDVTSVFFVLHDGESIMPIIFEAEGDYDLLITIEDTQFQWTDEVEVLESDDGSGGGDGGVGNITWSMINSGNVYTVNLFKEGCGYVQTGTVRVIKPDATMQDIPIISGSATITATTKGQYQLQYTNEGALFIEYIDYKPAISLATTAFSDSGESTVTLKVDGNTPSDAVIVNVQTPTGQNMITLINGLGTYTTRETGSHTFSVEYNGAVSTATIAYTEEYYIDDFKATVSADYNYVYVTGKVVGENSGDGKSGLKVTIICEELGYEERITSTSSGSIRTTIPAPKSMRGGMSGGRLVTVEFEFGDTGDDVTLTMKRDAVGELWWLWLIIIIILILIAKEMDWIYDKTGYWPSSKNQAGQKPRGSGGSSSSPGFIQDFP